MNHSKKQIILLMTDATRQDMVGCYGNPDMHTPNLDRLAENGVRYQNAYTCQPVCGPARSALFTGTYPHSNGSFANCIPLGANVKTIGQRLTDNGIRTAYIGKWHLDGGDYFGLGTCPERRTSGLPEQCNQRKKYFCGLYLRPPLCKPCFGLFTKAWGGRLLPDSFFRRAS